MHARLAILAVSLLACHGASDPPPSWDHGPVVEDAGPSWSDPTATRIEALALSADGAEIFYLAGDAEDGQALRAVRLSDGVVRTVDATPAARAPLYPSADGAALFFQAFDAGAAGTADDPRWYVREAFGGADLLLDPPLAGGFVAASSGRTLLVTTGALPTDPWGSGESQVQLLDVATGTVSPTPCGPIQAFSPAEDAIACTRPGAEGLIEVRLADGAITPLPVLTECERLLRIRWTSRGLLAVCSGAERGVLVADATAGEVLARLTAPEHGSLGGMAFTPDGGALVFLESECLAEDGRLPELGCDLREGRVRLLVLGSGAVSTLASTDTTRTDLFPLALSADGATVAYAKRPGTIHFRPIGR